MEGTSGAYRCLNCDTTVAPVAAWEQCKCGQLYVDTSGEGTTKFGCLDLDSVELVGVKGKRPKRSGDKFTDSSMMGDK